MSQSGCLIHKGILTYSGAVRGEGTVKRGWEAGALETVRKENWVIMSGMLLRAEFDSHHQITSRAVKCGSVQIP